VWSRLHSLREGELYALGIVTNFTIDTLGSCGSAGYFGDLVADVPWIGPSDTGRVCKRKNQIKAGYGILGFADCTLPYGIWNLHLRMANVALELWRKLSILPLGKKESKLRPYCGGERCCRLNRPLRFYSSNSHISIEEEQSTIFQNFICTRVDRGTLMTYVGRPSAMPCSLETTAFTEVGFARDEQFQGTVRIEADLLVGPMEPIVGIAMAKQFGLRAGQHRIVQTGRFSVTCPHFPHGNLT
jgi:hypothetical protein